MSARAHVSEGLACMFSSSAPAPFVGVASPGWFYHPAAEMLQQTQDKVRLLYASDIFKTTEGSHLGHLAEPPPCRPQANGSRETPHSLRLESWPWCTCSTSHHAPRTSSSELSPEQSLPGPLLPWCHRNPPANKNPILKYATYAGSESGRHLFSLYFWLLCVILYLKRPLVIVRSGLDHRNFQTTLMTSSF